MFVQAFDDSASQAIALFLESTPYLWTEAVGDAEAGCAPYSDEELSLQVV